MRSWSEGAPVEVLPLASPIQAIYYQLMKYLLPRLLAALTLIFTCAIQALPASADFRLATVDMGRILNEAPAAKKLKSDLDAKTSAAKKRLDGKRDELKDLETKAKASGSEDSPENLKFRSEAREYTENVRDSEEEIRREFMKANKSLSEAAVKAVQSYATKKKFDLVVDSSGRPGGAIVFAENSFDITEAVLKEING